MAFNYIINKLEPINLYGLGFPLRYKKEEKYPTLIGIILSMVTIFFVIVISILYGLDLIFRTGYSIVTNYIPLTKKTLIDFSNRPLMFGFATNGGKISKFDPSYISLTFDRNVHNSYLDENGIYQLERISTQVEMEPCNISKHFVGRNEFMGKFDYHNFLCTKPNQNLNFGGRFGDNINGYDLLEIHLNKCVNSSKNNNICKSEEILDKFLDNSYLTMIYISESVDHSNISFPLIQSLRNELYIVAKEHVKRYYQYFQMASYSSDVGLIWNKINFNIYLFLSYFRYYPLLDLYASRGCLFILFLGCESVVSRLSPAHRSVNTFRTLSTSSSLKAWCIGRQMTWSAIFVATGKFCGDADG